MNKINWRVRLKNPTFWLTFMPTLSAFIYATLGMFDVVPPITEDAFLEVCSVIVSALAALGVLVDPTTAGVGDSKRALGYNEPHTDGAKK